MCWKLVNDLNLKKGEKKEVVLCSFVVVVDIYNIHVHVCELKIEKIYFSSSSRLRCSSFSSFVLVYLTTK